MSSKLRGPESGEPAAPLVWRQVHAEGPRAATQMQEELRAQASRLEHEWEQRVRDARAAGVCEGEAAGRNRAAAELQPVIERLSRSIEELAGLRPRLRKDAESDMVKLSLAVARRVLRRELAIDPEALHGLVLAALEKLQGQEICRVRVHPSLAGSITACLRASPAAAAVEVAPDPSRDPGAVIFETRRGNLDASVDSQLQEIERGLVDRLRKQA
jgi:flagellar assembly protein FliH